MHVALAPWQLIPPLCLPSVPGLRWLIWGLVACVAVFYTPPAAVVPALAKSATGALPALMMVILRALQPHAGACLWVFPSFKGLPARLPGDEVGHSGLSP